MRKGWTSSRAGSTRASPRRSAPSLFRDQASAEVSDNLALQFGEELGEFGIERMDVIGGEVIVSPGMAESLEPAHA